MTTATKIESRDGTEIALYCYGSGPALVIVDAALCHHAWGPAAEFADALSPYFTVYAYDRRGRGNSGDTPPYAVAREVEDLAAVIEAAGGTAYVYGISSGAGLALEAAASGVDIARLGLFEPPYTATDSLETKNEHAELEELLSAGRRGEAVERFLSYVLPPEVVDEMKSAPFWPMLEAVAPTLAYDNAVMGDGTVPRDRAAAVGVPAIVVAGDASPDDLQQAARNVADAIPGGRYHVVAGLTHTSSPQLHVPVLCDFFSAD